DTIPGFTPVAPSIWSYTPTLPFGVATWKHADSPPSVIIIFSWTGAHGRHVGKYTTVYQTLFPTTPILVITTSTIDLCLRSSKRKQERLSAAVQWILSLRDHDNILIHAFSEGGSNKAVEFAEAYQDTTGTRLPCTALCLDSTPGHPQYLRLCSALRKSLPPNPVLRGTGLVLGGAFLGSLWMLYCCFVGYSNNVISQTRERIADPRFWSLKTPRCFLYSEADDMIDWMDIREHMRDAMVQGIPVRDVRFEGSGHCKHAAEDPERYWRSVMSTWWGAML
ncbi:hypothetical protein K458DRAFT_274493, partial [Lentithecium fluviatile CBS 122367]